MCGLLAPTDNKLPHLIRRTMRDIAGKHCDFGADPAETDDTDTDLSRRNKLFCLPHRNAVHAERRNRLCRGNKGNDTPKHFSCSVSNAYPHDSGSLS